MKTNKNENYEQGKEYMPLTPYNIDDFALTSEDIIEYGKKFDKFLGELYCHVYYADIDSKTLGIFYKMINFILPNGVLEFFIDKIRDDEKEVIKAIEKLKKEKLIEVIKIEKRGYDTFIKLQLIGNLRVAYDRAFKE